MRQKEKSEVKSESWPADKLTLGDLRIPLRPNYSDKSTKTDENGNKLKIHLKTNHFELLPDEDQNIYRYDCTVTLLPNTKRKVTRSKSHPIVSKEQGPDEQATSTPVAAETAGHATVAVTEEVAISTAETPESEGDMQLSEGQSLDAQPADDEGSKKPNTPKRILRRLFDLLLKEPVFKALDKGVATNYSDTILTTAMMPTGEDDSVEIKIKWQDEEELIPQAGADEYMVNIKYRELVPVPQLMEYLRSPSSTKNFFGKQDIITCLQMIMTRSPSQSDCVISGNRFFPWPQGLDHKQRVGSKDTGLWVLRGFYASVRTSTMRLLLNVNMCTSVFYPPINLTRFILDNQGKSESRDRSLEALLKGVKIRIHSKDWEGKRESKIRTIQKVHHQKADASDFPEVDISTKKGRNCVNPDDCSIVAKQMFRGKLTNAETDHMLYFAARPPAENARQILGQGLDTLGMNSENPFLKAFQIKASQGLIQVHGRHLSPPRINYDPNQQTKQYNFDVPQCGSWNMRNRKYTEPEKIASWVVLRLRMHTKARSGDSMYEVDDKDIAMVKLAMEEGGMTVHQVPFADRPEIHDSDSVSPKEGRSYFARKADARDKNKNTLRRTFQTIERLNTKAQFVLLILPHKSPELYTQIKYFAEIENGIHTVCCLGSKLSRERGQKQYCANLALKFNLKANGTNWIVDDHKLGPLNKSEVMFVGMDVTHPSPGSIINAPSIAAVVASIGTGREHRIIASLDNPYIYFNQFPGCVETQTGKSEMIENLEEMFLSRLALFKEKAKALPKYIIVYRDGVSEGQYQSVLDFEKTQMVAACRAIYLKEPTPDKRALPKMAIIIVGKRHHTRFFPTEEEDTDEAKDKDSNVLVTGNPKPGTIVDNGVTMEAGWDFYLQAHEGLKGTAKPAHYVVLYNTIKELKAEQLEAITNNLCYLFPRTTKAISICPPAYYADLLCERGRCYLYSVFNTYTPADARKDWKKMPLEEKEQYWTGGVHGQVRDSMYYI